MRPLITGAGGQLGRALQELLPNAIAADRTRLDIADRRSVEQFNWAEISAVYNAASYTNVDGAEKDLASAWEVNTSGTANLAIATRQQNIPLVHISTDYVFDGAASGAYREDDPVKPLNHYGRTKAASELAAAINPQNFTVRTSWVYGEGNNFVRTMLALGGRDELRVVDDQRGRPTFAGDLAQALVDLVNKRPDYGIYHATNGGPVISWADFAKEIFAYSGHRCTIKPITTAEYAKAKPGMAPRPAYSALDLDKLESAGINMPDWKASLHQYLKGELS